MKKHYKTLTEAQLLGVAAQFAEAYNDGLVVYLQGDLGAGKTTFTRGLLHALGHVGAVKSPTYTLVEPYDLAKGIVYHFDLYRLNDPEELEFMGIREYFNEHHLCVIEWPSCGEGFIAEPDIIVQLERESEQLRQLTLHATTAKGQVLLQAMP